MDMSRGGGRSNPNLAVFSIPIADKLLVAATLLMLTAFERLPAGALLPALVILCREILVSGLREYLAELRVGLPVSRLAKWKTAIQMTAIGFLIVGEAGPALVPVEQIGAVLLWAAALLTLVTGYDYLRAGLSHMSRHSDEPRARAAARQTAALDIAALSYSATNAHATDACGRVRRPPSETGARGPRMLIFGLAGWSGSGKTTLLTGIIPELTARGLCRVDDQTCPSRIRY